jgi:hypothetical protein
VVVLVLEPGLVLEPVLEPVREPELGPVQEPGRGLGPVREPGLEMVRESVPERHS